MLLKELEKPLQLKLVTEGVNTNKKISGGYASDLLSWVMAKAHEDQVWITIQSHQNVVAVASLLNLAGIIVAEGAVVDEETINKAQKENIPIFTTEKSIYEICGILYNLLVGSRGKC